MKSCIQLSLLVGIIFMALVKAHSHESSSSSEEHGSDGGFGRITGMDSHIRDIVKEEMSTTTVETVVTSAGHTSADMFSHGQSQVQETEIVETTINRAALSSQVGSSTEIVKSSTTIVGGGSMASSSESVQVAEVDRLGSYGRSSGVQVKNEMLSQTTEETAISGSSVQQNVMESHTGSGLQAYNSGDMTSRSSAMQIQSTSVVGGGSSVAATSESYQMSHVEGGRFGEHVTSHVDVERSVTQEMTAGVMATGSVHQNGMARTMNGDARTYNSGHMTAQSNGMEIQSASMVGGGSTVASTSEHYQMSQAQVGSLGGHATSTHLEVEKSVTQEMTAGVLATSSVHQSDMTRSVTGDMHTFNSGKMAVLSTATESESASMIRSGSTLARTSESYQMEQDHVGTFGGHVTSSHVDIDRSVTQKMAATDIQTTAIVGGGSTVATTSESYRTTQGQVGGLGRQVTSSHLEVDKRVIQETSAGVMSTNSVHQSDVTQSMVDGMQTFNSGNMAVLSAATESESTSMITGGSTIATTSDSYQMGQGQVGIHGSYSTSSHIDVERSVTQEMTAGVMATSSVHQSDMTRSMAGDMHTFNSGQMEVLSTTTGSESASVVSGSTIATSESYQMAQGHSGGYAGHVTSSHVDVGRSVTQEMTTTDMTIGGSTAATTSERYQMLQGHVDTYGGRASSSQVDVNSSVTQEIGGGGFTTSSIRQNTMTQNIGSSIGTLSQDQVTVGSQATEFSAYAPNPDSSASVLADDFEIGKSARQMSSSELQIQRASSSGITSDIQAGNTMYSSNSLVGGVSHSLNGMETSDLQRVQTYGNRRVGAHIRGQHQYRRTSNSGLYRGKFMKRHTTQGYNHLHNDLNSKDSDESSSPSFSSEEDDSQGSVVGVSFSSEEDDSQDSVVSAIGGAITLGARALGTFVPTRRKWW